MITTQGHYKNVQLREAVDEAVLGAILGGEEIKERRRAIVRKKLP